jgi:heme exporter protein CcmD
VTDAGYVFGGYAATLAVLAAYAGWIISRTRRLRRDKSERP